MTSGPVRGSSAKRREIIVAVIPAYNEESTIGAVVDGLRGLVDRVYVVDDGSMDETASRAAQAGAEVMAHGRNRGIGAALQTGYDAAIASDADLLVQLDADGQHNPDDLVVLLSALDPSTDIAIGSRFVGTNSDGYSLTRRLGIWFFSLICSALGGTRIFDVTSGFRIYRMPVLSRLPPLRGRHWAVEQTLMAMRLNLRIKEVGIEIPPRRSGESQFQPRVALVYPVRMLAAILRALRHT